MKGATAITDKPASPIFGLAEAAAYLNLAGLGVPNPVESINYLAKSGQLRSIVVLGRRAFLREHLDSYIADREQAAQRKDG